MYINRFLSKILENKILISILLLAMILRFWNLGGIPPHLRNDEAALGYNAYSIMLTGRDEHGDHLPIFLKSFGDWKPGLYVYTSLPFVYFLGLTEQAVRLPSAIAGVIAVLVIYYLVLSLLKDKRIALLSAFLLTISSWHIAFSRGAWEANVSLTFLLIGLLTFIYSLKNNWLLLFSGFFFGLTLITSHGSKLSTLITVICLLIVYLKEIFKFSKKILVASFLVGLLFFGFVGSSFVEGKIARISTLSIFSYPRSEQYIQSIILQSGETKNDLSFILFHSEPVAFTRSILIRWLSHYSPNFLFISGDKNPQHGSSYMGYFLLIDSLLLLFGVIYFTRAKFSKNKLLLILLLLLLPLPSALTIEQADIERSPGMLIPMLVIVACGFNLIITYLNTSRLRIGFLFFCILYILNIGYLLDVYFVHTSKKNDAWQYGYKQVAKEISLQDKKHKFVVERSLEQPYIFFLFYNKYDPSAYQKMSHLVFIPNSKGKDMGQVSNIDNIYFENLSEPKYRLLKDITYISSEKTFSSLSDKNLNLEIIGRVKDLNDLDRFIIFKNND